MSTRYVWGKYTREVRTGYRTVYQEETENIGRFQFNMTDGQSYAIGSGYYFSKYSGSYSTTGNSYYTFKNQSLIVRGAGYITATSGAMYYGSRWQEYTASNLVNGANTIKYTTTTTQEQYTYYVRGSLTGYVTSSNSGQYPSDDYTGSNWYVRLGSDSIDAKSVTIPSQIDGGTMINILIEPATNLLGNTTISYVIQYRFNDGTWTALTTTTTTQYTLSVPMDTQTVQVRVQAKDNVGFTSTDYTTSETVSVTNGDPPVVSSDLGSSPYDMGQVSEPFTFEYTITDPDYGDSATVEETLYFGENLGTATSEKENILSGSKLSFSLFQDLATKEELTVDDIFLLIPNETPLYASVKAVDSHGLESEEYKVTFEKYVDEVTIKLDPPLSVTGSITNGVVYVNGYIPTDAEFYVHVTNNANDEEPVWQDITADVLAGRVFKLTNAKAESGASFSFIVHAKRGESKEGGFIDSVVGAFG